MLSSWFGLEPIPICSIDRAPFSGPESRSGASLTDWTTGKSGSIRRSGRTSGGSWPSSGGVWAVFPASAASWKASAAPQRPGWRGPRGAPGAPPRCALGQGLDQVVRQLRFMRFAHSGPPRQTGVHTGTRLLAGDRGETSALKE